MPDIIERHAVLAMCERQIDDNMKNCFSLNSRDIPTIDTIFEECYPIWVKTFQAIGQVSDHEYHLIKEIERTGSAELGWSFFSDKPKFMDLSYRDLGFYIMSRELTCFTKKYKGFVLANHPIENID